MKRLLDSFLNIHKVGLGIVVGQVVVTLFLMSTQSNPDALTLKPHAILQGEWWRLITFPLLSPSGHLIWNFFWWMLLILYTESLENTWGSVKFNSFLWIGYAATLLAAFATLLIYPAHLHPQITLPNIYWLSSLFLAFAILNPNYELLLFFILPVQIKWIALFTATYWAFALFTSDWITRLAILGGTLNIALFFFKTTLESLHQKQRKKSFESSQRPNHAFHTCTVCKITDQDDPDMEFIYKDGKGYCQNHYKKPHE